MRACFAVVILVLLLVPASAVATSEVEPNNSVATATDLGGITYDAAINNAFDIDYYRFTTTRPFEQVELIAKYIPGTPTSPAGSVPWEVGDAGIDSDAGLKRISFLGGWAASNLSAEYTSFAMRIPDPGTYYLKFMPTLGVLGYYFEFRYGTAVPSGEPNDSISQATDAVLGQNGPSSLTTMTAGWDADVFRLPVKDGASTITVKLALNDIRQTFELPPWDPAVDASVIDAEGRRIVTAVAGKSVASLNASRGNGAVDEINVLVPAGTPTPVYLKVESRGYQGGYNFTLGQSQLGVGTQPGQPLSTTQKASKCADSTRNVKKATRTVAAKRKAYRKRRVPARKRALKLAQDRLKRQKANVKRYC